VFKAISSVLGIGYLKGSGTVAAMACWVALHLALVHAPTEHLLPAGLLTVSLLALGTRAAHRVKPDWGKDSSRVVIDEVAGRWIILLLVPLTIPRLLLFRFFDIESRCL
jgi:phosphatidylglycerophosphatase A